MKFYQKKIIKLYLFQSCHGFFSLVDNCKILYFHTERYNSKFERGINLNDPLLKINLPHPPLHISKRDQNFEFLTNNFKGIKV